MISKRQKVAPSKTLFLDRDGTIIVERDYLSDPAQVMLEGGAAEGIRRFAEMGYRIVVVSNQSGIGRGYFSQAELFSVNERLAEVLCRFGAHIDAWYHCPHPPEVSCSCRKPLPGMLDAADVDLPVNWGASIMAGDKPSDVEAAKSRGVSGWLVMTGYGPKARVWAIDQGINIAENLSDLADKCLGGIER